MPKRRPSAKTGGGESSDNYLGSVSDLMAALTFVFILTVAVFALRLAQTEEQVNEIIKAVQESRERLLVQVENRLKEHAIEIQINPDQGVLRIREDAIFFVTGEESPDEGSRQKVGRIARVLAEVLPCYVQRSGHAERKGLVRPSYCVSSPSIPLACTSNDSTVDTVLIEGHTDSKPFLGKRGGNLDLASRRSQEVFRMITDCEPSLEALFNSNDLRVLGVSGYGEHRPVSATASDDQNRRIDLRFMMELPNLEAGERPKSEEPMGKVRQGIER